MTNYTIPRPGDTFAREFNQADRDCIVLAWLANQTLFYYEMPAGRIFLGIEDGTTGKTRPISLKAMPSKWIKAIKQQGGQFTIEMALANFGRHDRSEEDKQWFIKYRVPQWIKDLNNYDKA